MGLGKRYVVPFAGLKTGTHQFEFEADDKFFKELKNAEVETGKVLVNLSLIKQSTMMILDFQIGGTFDVLCDRCAIPYGIPLKGRHQLIVKLGDEEQTGDDEVITLPFSESEIDLAPYINEYITLSLPARKVPCEILSDGTLCDLEMIEKLENLKTKKDKPSDERWDKLKNIKLT